MASIIACPGCKQDVTLPEELDGALICPHCEAEFRLQAVLVESPGAVEAEQPCGTPAGGAGAAPHEAGADDPAAVPAQAFDGRVAPDQSGDGARQELASSDALPGAAGSLSGDSPSLAPDAATAVAAPSESSPQAAASTAGGQTDSPSDRQPNDRITIDVPDADTRRTTTAVHDFSGIDASDSEDLSAATMAARATARRRRKGPGLLGHAVGIVGGGFLGLALGYYLLNLIGGERFNFLNIWLPGIRHTQKSREPEQGFPPFPQGTNRPSASGTWQALPPRTQDSHGLRPVPHNPRSHTTALGTQQPAPTVQSGSSSDTPGAGHPGGTGQSPTAGSSAPPARLPTYTPDELVQALAAARTALVCPRCRGSGRGSAASSGSSAADAADDSPLMAPPAGPCSECGGQPDRPLTPAVYHKLCLLAEVLTFVSSDDGRAQQHRDAVQWVFRKATETAPRRAALGRLGQSQLTASDRPSGGIVLLGRIRSYGRHQNFHLMQVDLLHASGAALIVSSARAPYEVGTPVVVAGSLITDPARVFGADRPTHSQVVVGGLSLRVDEP
jgi:hypothetical protein